uniref:Uncharacterized protein n=1 Tax=Rhizophora mucronata TaxID=61149 RepID=A0A2P2PGM8_RHIMU
MAYLSNMAVVLFYRTLT